MKHIFTSIFFSALNILSACSQQTYEQKLKSLYKGTVTLIQPESLDSLMAGEDIVLLDTRSPEEFKVSHLKNAQFVDYDNFELSEITVANKEKTVIVYCSVGYRSERVGEQLKAAGYKNVYNLYGGIFQWKNEQRPVYNPEGEQTDSVHVYNKRWGQWLEDGKGIKITN